MSLQNKGWDNVITAESSFFLNQLQSLWDYKDLLWMFVKRDFVAVYKQTILGPIWFFLQPLLTSFAFYLVFSKVAGLKTAGIPPVLFYLSGLTLWNYFAETLTKIATTFRDNQAIFGKVYFPRLIVPIAVAVSGLIKLLIQFSLFLGLYLFYLINIKEIAPQPQILLFPLLILLTAGLGLGIGLLITSLTVKYRDLVHLLSYGIQLLMYTTPVVYSLDQLGNSAWFIMLNPLTPILEAFRFSFFGIGQIDYLFLGISAICCVIIILFGLVAFNRTEKSFMDIV